MTLLGRIAPYLVALLLVGSALFGAYQHGLSVKDAEWQDKWSDRDTRDAAARADNEAVERAKEQARQTAINKVVQDGQQIIDQATADAVAARRDLSVRDEADRVAARIAASQSGSHSCTAAASAAATRAVMVFADVFKRADERAGDLAADADQSRGRGVTCERAYDALGK